MASKDFEHNSNDNRYQRTTSSLLASDTPEGIQKNIGRSVEQNKPEDSLNLHRQGIKSGAGDITKRTDVLPGHPPLILSPELADTLPAQDALAAEALWWENPSLMSLFTRVMEFLQLLCVQPECYQLLQELLEEIGLGIGEFTLPQGAKVANFAGYLGFAEKCFVLYQEALQSQRVHFYPDIKTPTKESGETIQCLFCVRLVLLRFTHRSPIFCELLVETGMLWFLLKDLEHMYHCNHDQLAESSVFLQSFGCLHNCCRHSDVLCVAKETVKHVSPFLSSPNKKIRMIALMTLAHVVDEGQYDLLTASNDLLALFLSEMDLALRSERHHHDFCNVEELLHALRRVAKLDSNKAVLRQTGAQVVVKRVLTEGSDREKLQAVLVLWELAFDSDSSHAVQRSRERMMSEWLEKRDNLMQILRAGPVEMVLNELNALHAQGQGQRNASPIYSKGQLLDVVLQLIMQDDVNARDFVDRGLLNVLNAFVKCGRQEEEEEDCIHLILRTDGKHVVSFEQTHIYLHVISEMAKTETVNRSREQSAASGHCTGQAGVTLSTGQGLATVSKQGEGGGGCPRHQTSVYMSYHPQDKAT